jgi:hypothetical protein
MTDKFWDGYRTPLGGYICAPCIPEFGEVKLAA